MELIESHRLGEFGQWIEQVLSNIKGIFSNIKEVLSNIKEGPTNVIRYAGDLPNR